MLHKSTLESFIAHELMNQSTTDSPIDLHEIYLGDLKSRTGSKIQQVLLKSFAFIKKDDSLLNAKKKMQQNAKILDVFATKDGKPDGPVMGWITNRIIMDKTNV